MKTCAEYYMGVSSQVHGPAALPSEKEASLSIGWMDYRGNTDAGEKRKIS
jgi:hypothetical protein